MAAKELFEARCARAMASSLAGPGPPFPLPNGTSLLISSAPGVEIGSAVWEGTSVLLQHLYSLPSAALRGARVLELGCGVGVVGIACAALGAAAVELTDNKPALLSLVKHNIAANAGVARGCSALPLNWGVAGWTAFAGCKQPTLLLGADLVYTDEGAARLCETLACALHDDARLLLAYRERGQGPAFFATLEARGLAREAVHVAGAHTVFEVRKL